ncbi:MAG: hypothetical protein E5W28_07160 [Mesorhizobium sp.]|uniref:hypothetical protein n=1 Tax=Mesorhizobium sp. TaxID=1871066 RepID=UPI000FE5AD77|nr:hypothetical protein [Mesorhizobium sp.]RWC12887.1 MAG: hypothetical protein EOS52_17710 [Mesorhizobium sp.]TIU37511.1 MAG: hypothetical protein E5W28_07160 [Mesorhizobium sp.]TJW65510.1 MAG: hypothetical protein E5V97_01630 [Mesorhizobium sp.]
MNWQPMSRTEQFGHRSYEPTRGEQNGEQDKRSKWENSGWRNTLNTAAAMVTAAVPAQRVFHARFCQRDIG